MIQERTRCPRDFALALAPADLHRPVDPFELRCRDKVNQFVDKLAAQRTAVRPDVARDQALVPLCDRYMALLHDRADGVVGNGPHRLSVEELLYTRYEYEGQFDTEVQRLRLSVFYVTRDPLHPSPDELFRVGFDPREATTKEQADLVRAIKAAETVIDVVLRRPRFGWLLRLHVVERWRTQRNSYVDQLIGIGRIGLHELNIELAEGFLKSLQDTFVAQYAAKVKNNYVFRLGVYTLLTIIINAAAYFIVCHFLAPSVRNEIVSIRDFYLADIAWRFRNFFLLAIGAAFGAWLGFLIQRPTLEFLGLVQLDENYLRPQIRIIYTIVLATVVGLLFWTGMVTISIGIFSTNFHNAGTPAVVIGAFCGIASAAIAAALAKRALGFASAFGEQADRSAAPRT